MSASSPRLSKSVSRFSRDGFVPLSAGKSDHDKPPKEVTADIPLAPVVGQGAATASANPYQSLQVPDTSFQEKSGGGGARRRFAGRRVKRSDRAADDRGRGHGDDGSEEQLTQMGRLYKRVLDFSILARYIILVVPVALLIAIPIVLGATAAKKAKLGGVRIVWIFTWVEVVWLSLWVAKIFARVVPAIFQFLSGIVSAGTRKYAAVLAALETPLTLVGWALASLGTFAPLVTRKPKADHLQDWQQRMNSVLTAALVASLIFFAQRLFIQMISVNYHRKQFDAKIKVSKRHVHLLSLLYEASRTLFPADCSEFAEEDYLINGSIAAGTTRTATGHQQSGSATPLRLIHNVGRMGDKLTAAFGNVASEIAGKQVFNPTSAHSVVVEALEKRKSSEALARRLWMSFVVEGKDALFQEDIVEVLGSDRQAEAEEAFNDIDRDGNGDISLDEMILTVVEFGRDRHSIATSLADVDQAIQALDRLLCTIVFIVIVFVFVVFLNATFQGTLVTAGAALLSVSFVFATTAQEVLGSCIFLFIKHPYDVGDRVDILNEQLTVEHISLLFSIFKRVDTHRIVQIPHLVLNSNWIDNVSRSKAMREQIKLFINFDTTMEDINALKHEIQAFVRSKENARDFLPEVEVDVIGVAEMNKLELMVEVKHKSNWSNETLRATRRSKFMCALVLALRRVPIYAPGAGDAVLGDVGKPTYSVTVSDAQAEAGRAAFAAKKEAKRLFPRPSPAETEPEKVEGNEQGKSSGNDYFNGDKSNVTGWQQYYNQHNGNMDNNNSNNDTRPSTAAVSEMTAVEMLTVRPPGEDVARDNWDTYRDNPTTPGGRPIAEARRENEIEGVRGMLRRESTRGRRKVIEAPLLPAVSAIAEIQTPPLPAVSPLPTTFPTQMSPGPGSGLGRANASPIDEQTSTMMMPISTFSGATYYPVTSSPSPSANASLRTTNRSPPPGNAFAQRQLQYRQSQQQKQVPGGLLSSVAAAASPFPVQQPPPQKPLPKDP